MKGVNKVILIGILGKDPEVKMSEFGSKVTTTSLATNEEWKDKNTGQKQQKTEWHRIVFFNRLADIAGDYLKKGSKVYIEGKNKTRKWQSEDGTDRYVTEVVATELRFLGGGDEPENSFDETTRDRKVDNRSFQENMHQSQPKTHQNMQPNFDDVPF